MVTTKRSPGKGGGGQLERLAIAFDDGRAVANAGLVLASTLAERLGVEAIVDETVDLGGRAGAARPGRKLLTLVGSALIGGDSIDDANVLRCGETERALAHRVLAPSTLGTFLRSFTFGHVRQLDRAFETIIGRAWAAGAGPGAQPLTIDLDSTIVEVAGRQKQGASFGYTKQRGYHPLLATRADTGELLHARMRKGSASTQRGAERFVCELVTRVRRLGAAGTLTVRADSGFWSNRTIAALERHGVRYSIGVTQQAHVRAAIEQIPDAAWQPLAGYPAAGIAEIAEGTLRGRRLIVRRTRLVGAQAELFPDWRYHAFVTDRPEPLAEAEAEHRRHAQIELAIRDLKEGSGLNHAPSGRFCANAAWLLVSCLAHNLLRWIAALGLELRGPIVAQTLRRRYLTLPGRITRSGRRRTLHLPARWPWRKRFTQALMRLRALPLLA
ncbi:MAG: IS1380 family transposase [Actinobacteria bacterium]|nr:IS1380 family transposase [Actinomycetota bacterium]MCA1698379.1 IS1380 family transposase [Actinomycetota bacterium]